MRSSEDSALIKTLVERLQHEAVHVALIGHDTAAVDEQGRRLVQRLRQDAGLEVVLLFDAQEDTLIARVNQRLASFSLDQARQAASAPAPLQVWVLQVQTAAQSRQTLMLARMVRDFPAVNLRLVVLLTPAHAPTLLDDPLGRAFLPWRLPGRAPLALDEAAMRPEPAPEVKVRPPPPRPAASPSLFERARARWRYPPDPGMVAAIAITLLFISVLVRCG